MDVDLNKKLVELETKIEYLTDQMKTFISNELVEIDLEEEIQEDIHCCF